MSFAFGSFVRANATFAMFRSQFSERTFSSHFSSLYPSKPPIPTIEPVGSVIAFAGDETSNPVPKGWVLCDGRIMNSSQYPELFAAIWYAIRDRWERRFWKPAR